MGFAPGAWTQFAVHRLEEQNLSHNILGIDINLATPVKGCHYMQGDIMNKSTHAKIRNFLKSKGYERLKTIKQIPAAMKKNNLI